MLTSLPQFEFLYFMTSLLLLRLLAVDGILAADYSMIKDDILFRGMHHCSHQIPDSKRIRYR